ncbi:MAG: hypothetical protein WBQ23_02625 [Bacteroidota bacterium]
MERMDNLRKKKPRKHENTKKITKDFLGASRGGEEKTTKTRKHEEEHEGFLGASRVGMG